MVSFKWQRTARPVSFAASHSAAWAARAPAIPVALEQIPRWAEVPSAHTDEAASSDSPVAASAAAVAAAAAAAASPAAGSYRCLPDLNARVRVYQGDITGLQVDAVTNAANSALQAGGGICGAIFSAAGSNRLQRACNAIRAESGYCPPGQTRLTRGFQLPAPFVLHTVGPNDGNQAHLEGAYRATLDECVQPRLLDVQPDETVQIRSVALCCISTGIFGFDNEAACHVALRTTREWLEADPIRAAKLDAVLFVVFLDSDKELYQQLLPVYFPRSAEEEAASAKFFKALANAKGRRAKLIAAAARTGSPASAPSKKDVLGKADVDAGAEPNELGADCGEHVAAAVAPSHCAADAGVDDDLARCMAAVALKARA